MGLRVKGSGVCRDNKMIPLCKWRLEVGNRASLDGRLGQRAHVSISR